MSLHSDPIVRVSVISTGSVAIRPEHVGPTWKPAPLWLATSRRWTDPRPINVYVIEHQRGVVLFDTGQDRASVTDPGYFPSGLNGLVYSRLARFAIDANQTLDAGLAGLGYQLEDISTAVISHLHQDHIGGLPMLGHAELLVSRTEWDTLAEPLPHTRGLLRDHIDLPGLRWNRITFQPLAEADLAPFSLGHDLFGDGSLVLLPTPGHTPGSMSMLIRRPTHPPLLLVGDLTYDAELLAAGEVPGVGDKAQMRSAVDNVNQLRAAMPDLSILAAHDPHAADRLADALTPRHPA